jgi:hypothetical protein
MFLLTNGTIVAETWDALVGATPIMLTSINLNEWAATPSAPDNVWTSVAANGTYYATNGNCNNWTDGTNASTATTGLSSATNATWTNNGTGGCDVARRLYCFEK